MMVQAPEEVGEISTDTQDTPILTQPSSSQPQRKHKSRRKQRKAIEVPYTELQTKEHIPTPSHDLLPSAKIEKLMKIVKKLKGKNKKRTHRLKRLYKGRIAEIDVDEDLSLINETAQDQGRMNGEDLFKVNDLDGDEVIVDVIAGITAATTLQIFKDDVTLAQTLIEIKAAKPRAQGVIVKEPSKFRTKSSSQPSQLPQAKDKGKGIMIKAKIEEEERIARKKDEANIDVIKEWDDVQAIIAADRQLAEQL
nr:hypothetical protein [Tanacetum cinerariifolium]